MTDIFEEVDESLRRDKVAEWWQHWSLFVYAAIVLVIAGVGAFEFWKWQRSSTIERDAKVFDTAMTALENEDFSTARSTLAQLGQQRGGFAVLANHMLAGVERQLTNDTAVIGEHFVAASESDDGLMGDLAILKHAYAKADTAELAEIEAILAPVIGKGGHAAALARELVAAKALAGGDVDRARAEYQALGLEIEAPSLMKERVAQALATLPPRAPPGPSPATAGQETGVPEPAEPSDQPPVQPGQE